MEWRRECIGEGVAVALSSTSDEGGAANAKEEEPIILLVVLPPPPFVGEKAHNGEFGAMGAVGITMEALSEKTRMGLRTSRCLSAVSKNGKYSFDVMSAIASGTSDSSPLSNWPTVSDTLPSLRMRACACNLMTSTLASRWP